MGPLHITAKDQRLKNRIANAVEEAWFGDGKEVHIDHEGNTVFLTRSGDSLRLSTQDVGYRRSLADAPAAILKLLQG